MPLLVVLLGPALAAGVLSLSSPILFGRDAEPWELGALGALTAVLLLLWHRRRQRERRSELDGLRDSALW
ncbi:MAG: hypothetical protein ACO1PB_04880 [Ramlibacter sp.]